MKKREIEQRIRSAVNDITPDVYEKAASADLHRAAQSGQVLHKNRKRFPGRILAGGLAAALLLLALFAGGSRFIRSNAEVSRIGIDVNPSLEITCNRQDKVLDVIALNDDADVILEDMDLKKVDLNVAVNALVGSMVKHGYINEINNSILISVHSSDKEKESALQAAVSDDVNQILAQSALNATVINQDLSDDDYILDFAQTYQISEGKAAFICRLLKQDPGLDAAALASMSIGEITASVSRNANVNMNTFATDASAYIGIDAASEIALARVPGASLKEIELEYEYPVTVYEGELIRDNMEYEFKIDAYTGEIVKWEEEVSDHHQYPAETPQTAPTASESAPVETSAPAETQGSVKVTEESVRALVMEKLPDAVIKKLSYDYEDGRPVYEVEAYVGYVEYDIEIDANTGSIVKWKEEIDDDAAVHQTNAAAGSAGIISDADARALVSSRVPEAVITELKLDHDDGVQLYEGEAKQGGYEYEFEIDAYTGEFLKWEEKIDD